MRSSALTVNQPDDVFPECEQRRSSDNEAAQSKSSDLRMGISHSPARDRLIFVLRGNLNAATPTATNELPRPAGI